MYSKQTNSIVVTVIPEYQDSRSFPFDNIYIWSYHIHIENKGTSSTQLLNRHWKIVDAAGQVKEVVGAGVVGLQPVLAPGEKFEYSSETALPTSSGIMFGVYEMSSATGEVFNVEIPAFSLDCPHVKESIN